MATRIGIAIFPEHGETEVALVARSDAPMYLAKREGGGYTDCSLSSQSATA